MTQATASRLLNDAGRNINACGESIVAVGYTVESHTLGCRIEAGDADILEAHWKIWDEYSNDGKSIVIGDPADGVFVSITPVKNQRATMGAEMLIELGRRVKKTIPLKKAERIVRYATETLEPLADVVLVAGSVRRRRPRVGDVEFVVLPKNLEQFLNTLDRNGWTGGDRIRKKMTAGIPVEIYIAHKPEELGAMLFMYTGDFQHNIAMRSIAKRQGWKLDQYGIWDAKTGAPLLQSPDERDYYDFLGVDYHTPEERSFKDRSKKKATMGAEMLIELGSSKRNVGYINLEILSPQEDGGDKWVLRVERIDPFGGDAWKEDFTFDDVYPAMRWFGAIAGDEDLDALVRQASQ